MIVIPLYLDSFTLILLLDPEKSSQRLLSELIYKLFYHFHKHFE